MNVIDPVAAVENGFSGVFPGARAVADVHTQPDALIKAFRGVVGFVGSREVLVLGAVVVERKLNVKLLDQLVEDRDRVEGGSADIVGTPVALA